MSKKKAGHLSGSMIVRRRPREGAGFVVSEASDKPSTPSEQVDSGREAAQVVPLYPGPSGKAGDLDRTARSGAGGAHARADRLVDALGKSASSSSRVFRAIRVITLKSGLAARARPSACSSAVRSGLMRIS